MDVESSETLAAVTKQALDGLDAIIAKYLPQVATELKPVLSGALTDALTNLLNKMDGWTITINKPE